MPRSKNPDQGRWEIPYRGSILDLDSPTRRMVGFYMVQEGIQQPQAVAELIAAGYAQLVSIPLPPKNGGRGGAQQGDGGRSGRKPDRAEGRGRVADEYVRQEQSGPEDRRSPDSEAA